ncbi:MAG TPA: hypothetical protein VNV62_03150 [Trebonia sp.]|nr:hypothetical protein [Trebonia sp.]
MSESGGTDLVDTQAPTIQPGVPVGPEGIRTSKARRWLAVAAWAVGGVSLAAIFLRISLGGRVNSDGANQALQGWDLLHGHLLLHGWQMGDVNFYFLELPLNALTAAVSGLGNFSAHAASALTYLLVTVCAVALAVTDSRGVARLVRCLVVVIVLAAPLLTPSSMWLVLEEPDHIGTSVFILGSFLLIDLTTRPRGGSGAGGDGGRGAPHSGESSPSELAASRGSEPARWWPALVLCVILCAGEFSDLTVRYVAVPAVVVVCGYRALAARRLRSQDATLVVAALLSVPLTVLMSAVMGWLGGFGRDAPGARLVPVAMWPKHAEVTWTNLRDLFGTVDTPFTKLGSLGAAFALACLLAAGFGVARVGWAWWRGRATRAEQLLAVAIVCNIGADTIITLTRAVDPHEIAVVLPCGAVLAARALVPARITNIFTALVAVTATAFAAVLPLASAATLPLNQAYVAPLTAWLEAHHLTYGLAQYWEASASTLQSGGRIQILTVDLGKRALASVYEVNTSWYDPSLHDATFVVVNLYDKNTPPAAYERSFGHPAATYHVSFYLVMVYRTNLLRLLPPVK